MNADDVTRTIHELQEQTGWRLCRVRCGRLHLSDQSIDRLRLCLTKQLDVPLLIMHGGHDKLPVSQSLDLAQQSQKSGKTYELIVYAEDNHYLKRNQDDRDRRATAWFKRYLKN